MWRSEENGDGENMTSKMMKEKKRKKASISKENEGKLWRNNEKRKTMKSNVSNQ